MLKKHSDLFVDPVPIPEQMPASRTRLPRVMERESRNKGFAAHSSSSSRDVIVCSDDDDDYVGGKTILPRVYLTKIRSSNVLVQELLGLVSDEGGKGTDKMKMSLSYFNGFQMDGAMDYAVADELLDSHRIFVADCILRDLIKPILTEFLEQKGKSPKKWPTPSEKFKGEVADILLQKMGLQIYK
jgi:hypothetical protein